MNNELIAGCVLFLTVATIVTVAVLNNARYKPGHRRHICQYWKPIACQYNTFSTRRIVFECDCGKREIRTEYSPFDKPFSMQTNLFISHKEMDQIAAGATFKLTETGTIYDINQP